MDTEVIGFFAGLFVVSGGGVLGYLVLHVLVGALADWEMRRAREWGAVCGAGASDHTTDHSPKEHTMINPQPKQRPGGYAWASQAGGRRYLLEGGWLWRCGGTEQEERMDTEHSQHCLHCGAPLNLTNG